MSDPDVAEPPPPPQPPRPQGVPMAPTSTEESQLAADEQYARQLAEYYNGSSAVFDEGPRSGSRNRRTQQRGPPRQTSRNDQDNEPSWFDGTLITHGEILVMSNDLTRGIAHSQGQHQKGLSRNSIDSQ